MAFLRPALLAAPFRSSRNLILCISWLLLSGIQPALAEPNGSASILGCVISGGANTNVSQTCNFNPRFGLTPEAIKNIVAVSAPGKPVVLTVIGGNRAQQMGNELQQALTAAGLTVQRIVVGMMSPPPDDPLTIDTRGPETLIVLFPAA